MAPAYMRLPEDGYARAASTCFSSATGESAAGISLSHTAGLSISHKGSRQRAPKKSEAAGLEGVEPNEASRVPTKKSEILLAISMVEKLLTTADRI